MKKGAIGFLLMGVLAGFLATYMAVRNRDLGPIVLEESAVAGSESVATQADLEKIRDLQLELQADPRNLQILWELANLHLNIQDFSAAIDYFQRALEIAPGDLDLQTDLGTAYYFSGRVDDAFDILEKTLEADPNHPQALFNLGFLFIQERGDQARGVELWQRLLRAHPDHPRADLVREELERMGSSL